MIAARLHGPRDLRVAELPEPVPGPGEVLVEVEAAGICGSDLHVWRTGDFVPRFPVTPGHEVVGVVRGRGPGAALADGTRVALDSRVPCGDCPECAAGRAQRCASLGFLGEVRDGGFATLVAVPETAAWEVPLLVPPDVAALAEPLAVALHGLAVLGRVAPEARRITILGAGPLGALLALALPGDVDALMVEPDTTRSAAVARATGRPVIRDASGLGQADAVIDCAGFAGSIDEAIRLCRPGGAVLALALHHAPEPVDANALVGSERLVAGSHVFEDEMPAAIGLLAAHPGRFAPLVSRTIGLPELPAAVAAAAEGRFGGLKSVVRPGEGT